jgi:hypothetical protein
LSDATLPSIAMVVFIKYGKMKLARMLERA